MKISILSGIMIPIMTFLVNISHVLICILDGYLAVKKSIEVGDVQSFIQEI